MKKIAYRMFVPAGLRVNASRRARMFYLAMVQIAGAVSLYRWFKIKQLDAENAQLRAQLSQRTMLEDLYRPDTAAEILEDGLEFLN